MEVPADAPTLPAQILSSPLSDASKEVALSTRAQAEVPERVTELTALELGWTKLCSIRVFPEVGAVMLNVKGAQATELAADPVDCVTKLIMGGGPAVPPPAPNRGRKI
jgi:hypothetical protein